jgi:hypothetical protein
MHVFFIVALVLASRDATVTPASEVNRVLAANHAAKFEYRQTDSGLAGQRVDRFDDYLRGRRPPAAAPWSTW